MLEVEVQISDSGMLGSEISLTFQFEAQGAHTNSRFTKKVVRDRGQ